MKICLQTNVLLNMGNFFFLFFSFLRYEGIKSSESEENAKNFTDIWKCLFHLFDLNLCIMMICAGLTFFCLLYYERINLYFADNS